MQSQDQPHDAHWGCLLRFFWFLLGNAMLVAVAAQLLASPRGWFSALDAVYWSIVALILAARYADIRYFKGTRADETPATLADWRRFASILVVFAGVVWLIVHLLGAFGFSR